MLTKITSLLSVAMLYSINYFACHLTTMSLSSSTDNGDGTYTYAVNVCIGEDGAFGETFNFSFVPSGGSFTSIASFSPAGLSNSYQAGGGPFGSTFGVTATATGSNSGSAITYTTTSSSPGGWPIISDGSLCGGSCSGGGLQACFTLTFTTNGTTNQLDLVGAEGSACTIEFITMGGLPVEMISLNAEQKLKTNLIRWSTGSETNNDRFEIERSNDGVNYVSIGSVKGQGNATLQSEYSFSDKAPLNGLNYYRLKQVDFDGSIKEYGPVAVDFLYNQNITIYPNPAETEVFIKVPTQIAGKNITSRVYSIDGKALLHENHQLDEYVANNFDLSHKCLENNNSKDQIHININELPKGTYIVSIEAGERRFSEILIKQ